MNKESPTGRLIDPTPQFQRLPGKSMMMSEWKRAIVEAQMQRLAYLEGQREIVRACGTFIRSLAR